MSKLIYIDQEKQIFHLHNQIISYIFRVNPKLNKLEHIYFGASVSPHPTVTNAVSSQPNWGETRIAGDSSTSLSRIMQEFPEFGTSDYRQPAFEIEYPAGDTVSNFLYDHYQIIDGAPQLAGLPQARYQTGECQTLLIFLKDQYSDLEIRLSYTIDQSNSCLIRNASIQNSGPKTYRLKKFDGFCLDLSNENFDLLTLNGTWGREKHLHREKIGPGIKEISSIRGASGHVHDPFIAIAQANATENSGRVYGISTIYSGNHKETVELDAYGVIRILTGINDRHFTWELTAGSSFTTPQSVLTFSNHGFNQMSQVFHQFINNHLLAPQWRQRKHPVLLNNWEATQFDFTESKIIELVTQGRELGCDLFVLDDGWFGHRDDDTSSLGDWTVNLDKLPHGLTNLSQKIHQLGMEFGLWFEPEAVSPDTAIFKEHPDWVIGVDSKNRTQGRNEYLLDFSNPAVIDNIFAQMDQILSQTKIEYIKWDMNRNMTEPFSNYLPTSQQGEFFHRYILGVYDLYQRLIDKYPDILFESCSGGGGRFDLGMLYYAPQTWGSDDTDPYERWIIQGSESYLYPLQTIGAHVSASPNQQTGRQTSLHTRGNVALFGTFGYELDLSELSDDDKAEIKAQIRLRKQYDNLLLQGRFYRLETIANSSDAWMVVSDSGKQALVCSFQTLTHPNAGYDRVYLRGLLAEQKYQINHEFEMYGDELMNVGLPLKHDSLQDFDSLLFEIIAI